MNRNLGLSSSQRFPLVAVFAICAIFLNLFPTAGPPIRAQADLIGQAPDEMLGPGIINTFTNPTSITIPSSGPGTPYPSPITVSNIPIQVAKVTVRLNSFAHTFPSDVDVLLVGPQGQTAIVMSDVGGSTDVNGITLTLDDAAAAPLPTAALTTGIFRPTNVTIGDPFPAPAPAPGTNSALSVFQGTNPNGTWSLFVVDDTGADLGSFSGGWTLSITAAISGQNTNSITIPASGMASPYPSEIEIANQNDALSRVLVTLTNFTHTSPDDVDVLLQSPSGRSVILMSDVGGSNAVANINISFDDSAANPLPDTGTLTTGTFRPTDSEPGEVFPAPAPSGGPIGRTLSSLNGTSANGTWRLFVVDDTGTNVGDISGGWNILVGTTAGAISMTGTGVANPYPSEISVSGLAGSITKATVTLSNFSHLQPDNVDILLSGPDGRRIVLMSDAGGLDEAGGVNLVFDDDGPSAIPDGGPLTSGTYRPADYEPGETYPDPAPPGPATGTTLNAFYGGVPNGIWRLYVLNENGASYGSIAGTWTVTLQTSTSACLVTISPGVQAFPVTGGSGSFNIGQPNGCSWTASTSDSFISITSATAGGGNGTITFTVGPNQGPPRTGTIDVTNGVMTRSFQVQQPSGCPLSLSQSTLNFPGSGGTGNVSVSAGDGCSWQGSTSASWIQITSQPQSGNGSLTFNVQANTTRAARSATINVGSLAVVVNQAPSRSVPFDFDGDARTDVSVFRPSNGSWWIARSTAGVLAKQFGISTDRIVPADYDGDLKADISVYRDGTWYILRSSDETITINSWGTSSDIPVPADYNADGSAELAIFRPSSGSWWILNPNGTFSSLGFGINGDIPTPGDYDGDGKTDLSVFRPGAQGTWWVLNSSNGVAAPTPFGLQGDIPVAADYDGDGRDNIAVFRPSNGTWYRSTNASTNYDAAQWGTSTDELAPGDYDGDGKSDPAVFRQGIWYILRSASGVEILQFGTAGDRPVPGAYVD
jgi:subtilisin-like proprotein convertase family protein